MQRLPGDGDGLRAPDSLSVAMVDDRASVQTVHCGICGQPVAPREDAVVTAASVLHVHCVEQSAAAA